MNGQQLSPVQLLERYFDLDTQADSLERQLKRCRGRLVRASIKTMPRRYTNSSRGYFCPQGRGRGNTKAVTEAG